MSLVTKWSVISVANLFIVGTFACNDEKYEKLVIVDVADFGRRQIAEEIEILASFKPRVVAVDIQFLHAVGTDDDLALKSALDKCERLVLASEIGDSYNGKRNEYRALKPPPPMLAGNAKTGFVNAILEDDKHQTLKKFSVYEMVNGNIEYNFAIRTAMMYDSGRTASFIKANPKLVNVSFTGNADRFKIYSARQVLERKLDKDDIEGRIVLVGSFSVFDKDIFYTPLYDSLKMDGPDMFGVVYLANVIKQILEEK